MIENSRIAALAMMIAVIGTMIDAIAMNLRDEKNLALHHSLTGTSPALSDLIRKVSLRL